MLVVVVVRPRGVGFEEAPLLDVGGARGAGGTAGFAGSYKPLVSHYSADAVKHSFLAHAHDHPPPPRARRVIVAIVHRERRRRRRQRRGGVGGGGDYPCDAPPPGNTRSPRQYCACTGTTSRTSSCRPSGTGASIRCRPSAPADCGVADPLGRCSCWSNNSKKKTVPGFVGQIKQHAPIFPSMVGVMDGAGEGSTTTIKFTPRRCFWIWK